MALPLLVRQFVEIKMKQYCDTKIPIEHQNEIKLLYNIRGNNVTLIESRPLFLDKNKWGEFKIAQFRYNPNNNKWALYCRNRNEKWFIYMNIDDCENLEDLLKEVDDDPTGIFWG